MQNNNRVGLEIETINNGYLLTGHKTNGYLMADTGKDFYSSFEELADALVGMVRQSLDLEFEPQPDLFGGAIMGPSYQ